MINKAEISVIICTYNRRDFILKALESLLHQTLSKEQFEVIVVNNNSPDDTEALVMNYIEKHPDIHILYKMENQQGASFARNTGAAMASAGLLAFMDDDAVAEPDFLEKILTFFHKYPSAAGLGGRIIPRYIPAEPKWMSYFVSSLVGNFDYSNSTTEFKPGKYPLESNMVVTKQDFFAVGGFNTALPGVKGNLRIGGEGKDFFLKLQGLGRTIYYDPNVIVHHVVEVEKLDSEYMYRVASGIGRGERVRMLSQSKWSFIKKVAEYLFKLGASFVLGLFYAVQGTPSKTWPVIKFRIDALKGLLGS